MEKNDLNYIELSRILKRMDNEKNVAYGYVTEEDLKKENISYGTIKLPNDRRALFFVYREKEEERIAVTYGMYYKRYNEVHYSPYIKPISDKDFDEIAQTYKEVKKEYDILEKVYNSQKVRGIFHKIKAIN